MSYRSEKKQIPFPDDGVMRRNRTTPGVDSSLTGIAMNQLERAALGYGDSGVTREGIGRPRSEDRGRSAFRVRFAEAS